MAGFLLSVRIVVPILLMLAIGMLVRHLGWVDEKSLNVMDRLGFKLFLPTQLFYSLYRRTHCNARFSLCSAFSCSPLPPLQMKCKRLPQRHCHA